MWNEASLMYWKLMMYGANARINLWIFFTLTLLVIRII